MMQEISALTLPCGCWELTSAFECDPQKVPMPLTLFRQGDDLERLD
jgi:hypothetical protein